MRRMFERVLIFTLLVGAATPLFAQTFGQITGQVTDTSGAILAGASVTVTSTQTNAVREAVTNSSGSYAFQTCFPVSIP